MPAVSKLLVLPSSGDKDEGFQAFQQTKLYPAFIYSEGHGPRGRVIHCVKQQSAASEAAEGNCDIQSCSAERGGEIVLKVAVSSLHRNTPQNGVV